MQKLSINAKAYLRNLRFDDAQAMFSIIDSQREYLGKYLAFVQFTQSVEDSQRFITSVLNSASDINKIFAIIVDEKFAGLISFKAWDGLNKKIELGYWLDKNHSNKGITTQAAQIMVNLAFQKMLVHRLVIKVAVGNLASMQIAKKLGLVFEGVERDGIWIKDNIFYDAQVYAKLKTD